MPIQSEPCAVSVIIPVLDPGELLDIQLEALAAQDFDGEFEVIVADNGSDKSSLAFLASHRHRDRLRLRVIDASDIRGPAHARNVGARHASAELLLFCDHDDQVHPNWVRRMFEFFRDEQVDLFSSAVESSTLNKGHRRHVAEISAPDDFQPRGVFAPVIVGCSLGARADAYEKLGGMDVTYRANEEVELGWRASSEGFTVGYLPEALVAYRYRTGIRAGYRQGIQRGVWMARLHADYPDNGLPPIKLSRIVYSLAALATSWKMTGEEWGLLNGISIGHLQGGIKYRNLHI